MVTNLAKMAAHGDSSERASHLKTYAKRYCLLIFATFFACCALWLFVALNQFGRQTNMSYGLCELAAAKREIAERYDSPKTLFVAGSSAIRGMDAARVHQATGLNMVNFGLHAGLPAGVILHEAKKVLRPGDSAILAFEYTAYTRTGPTSKGIDFVFGCGQDYFQAAPFATKIMMLFGLSPLRLVQPSIQSPEAFFERWGRDADDFGPRGDLPPSDSGDEQPDPARLASYGPEAVTLADGSIGARSIADFAAWARDNQIKVFATWPNTIEFAAYDSYAGFEEVRTFYEGLDIDVLGEPRDAMFPVGLHYNTNYHLNVEGIRKRTDKFIEILRETDGLLP